MFEFIQSALLWGALGLFVVGTLAQSQSSGRTSRLGVALGWVLFGLFWLTMVEFFLVVQDSFIEAALAGVALPIGVYAGYLTYTRETPELFTLARATTVMGSIYFIVERVDIVRRTAIEAVTVKTVWVVNAMFNHELVIREGAEYGYQSQIAAPNATGGLLLTHIELACTGLGSITIIVGLLAVLDESPRKRFVGAVVAASVIYALNVARTVFITSAYVGQWFQFYEAEVLAFTGYQDPRVVSFFIADKVISQSLSLLVMVIMVLVIVRVFPSFYTLIGELRSPSKP